MHTKRPQNSTIAGSTGLVGAIMLVLGNIELVDTFDAILQLRWDQVAPVVLIVAGSIRSICMKEKTKESIVREIRNKLAKRNESTDS